MSHQWHNCLQRWMLTPQAKHLVFIQFFLLCDHLNGNRKIERLKVRERKRKTEKWRPRNRNKVENKARVKDDKSTIETFPFYHGILLILSKPSGGSSISQTAGCQSLRMEQNLLFVKVLPKTAWKFNQLGRGGRP